MINGNYKYIKYLLGILIVFLAARPVPFITDLANSEGPIETAFNFLVILYFFIRFKNIVLSKSLLIVLGLYLLHHILTYLVYGTLHPRFLLIYLNAFLYAYIVINFLKEDIFKILDDIIYILCIITVPFYLWSILHENSLRIFLMALGGYSPDGNKVYSLFYVLRPDYQTVPPRNSGFCWEPGMFAVVLNTVIIFNIIKYKFILNKRLIIYIVLLLSTLSTTGYSSFLILVVFYFLNKYKGYSFQFFFLALPIFYFVFTLPFMGNKIQETADEDVNDVLNQAYSLDEGIVQPQRFSSLKIALVDFYRNPILGYGGHDEDSWIYSKYGKDINLSIVSGVGDLIATFGLYGIILFIMMNIVSLKRMSKEFHFQNSWLIFFVLMTFFISYRIFNMPLYHVFFLYFLRRKEVYVNPKLIKEEPIKIH